MEHYRESRADRSLGPIKDADRDWKKRAKADRIICLRQAIAGCRQDVEAFIALEKIRPDGHHNTMAIAERLCNAGRHSEALEWVRKRGRPGLKSINLRRRENSVETGDRSQIACWMRMRAKYEHAVRMLALGNAVPFVGPLTIDAEIKKFLFCPGFDKCLPIPPECFQFLVIAQNLVSIILVFFIGLALRNYFKIK